MCCKEDWEIRQPQDFVRGVPDTQIAPWTRPEPSDSFIPITYGPISTGPFNFTANNNTSLQIAVVKHNYTNIKLIDGSTLNKTTLG